MFVHPVSIVSFSLDTMVRSPTCHGALQIVVYYYLLYYYNYCTIPTLAARQIQTVILDASREFVNK